MITHSQGCECRACIAIQGLNRRDAMRAYAASGGEAITHTDDEVADDLHACATDDDNEANLFAVIVAIIFLLVSLFLLVYAIVCLMS